MGAIIFRFGQLVVRDMHKNPYINYAFERVRAMGDQKLCTSLSVNRLESSDRYRSLPNVLIVPKCYHKIVFQRLCFDNDNIERS